MAKESLAGWGFDANTLNASSDVTKQAPITASVQVQKEKKGFVSGLEAKPVVKKEG